MNASIAQFFKKWMKNGDQPMPFSADLEPCVFYRITPKLSPIIGMALIALAVLAAIAGLVSSAGVPWLALVSGVAAGALCIALPHMAGRWPGSNWLTKWEIAHERRSNRALSHD